MKIVTKIVYFILAGQPIIYYTLYSEDKVILRVNGMYAIHLVDIPSKGSYRRDVTMSINLLFAIDVAVARIKRLLHLDDITLMLMEHNIYDVYSGTKFVGCCVINAI